MRVANVKEKQLKGLRMERVDTAHTVDLRGRRKYDALLVPDARADDRQIRFEVELEHAQRLAHVRRRGRDRDQRQRGVAFLDVVFDPLAIDGDVAFEETESLLPEQIADPIGL